MLRKLFALLFFSFLTLAHAIGQELSRPYEVRWPPGWQISRIPAPQSATKSSGERIRALRVEGANVAAAMEIMHIVRTDRGLATLERQFDIALMHARRGYEAKGFVVTISPPRASSLGLHRALEADISATDANSRRRQWIAMTFTNENVYSFSFTAMDVDFGRFESEFRATLKSLVLR